MIKDYQILRLCGHPTFEKVTLRPPFRALGNFPNEACFLYLKQGSSKIIAPTTTVERTSGQGVVMQCGSYVNDYLTLQRESQCIVIAVHLYPDVLRTIYDKELPNFLEEVERVTPIAIEPYKASELMHTYIESLEFYFANPNLVSEELLKLKIKELVLLLARTDNVQAITQLLRGLFNRKTYDFREVIEANLYNSLSLEELAILTNLSLSSFKREFARQYDCPPGRYLRRRKLERSAELLRRTDLLISDIAFDCGFGDLAHFSKTFLKEYGVPPSQYRA